MIRKLKCDNVWWNSYGERVVDILTELEQKSFQNTYDGDVSYKETIFLLQGLIFALEKTQLDVDSMKSQIAEIDILKATIIKLNETINEMKEKQKNYEIETEVTIANLEHELEKSNDKLNECEQDHIDVLKG